MVFCPHDDLTGHDGMRCMTSDVGQRDRPIHSVVVVWNQVLHGCSVRKKYWLGERANFTGCNLHIQQLGAAIANLNRKSYAQLIKVVAFWPQPAVMNSDVSPYTARNHTL